MKTLAVGNPIKTLLLLIAGAVIGLYLGATVLSPISANDDDDDAVVEVVEPEAPIFTLVDTNGNPFNFTTGEREGKQHLYLVEPADDYGIAFEDDDDD